jgi:isopenicillin N synthase-like dioxygenase
MMEFSPTPGAGKYGHNEHTDIGTLTLLFNNQWGLQVNCGDSYKYVRPSERHAIVNVGDCLRFMSGNKLKSVLHRVAPPALTYPRSSFGYFLRPDDIAVIDRPDGTQISAQGWTEKKYVIHQSSLATADEKDMLTSWMEIPTKRLHVLQFEGSNFYLSGLCTVCYSSTNHLE